MVATLTDNSGQEIKPVIDQHIREVVRNLVDGDLASDGVQWSAEVPTTTVNVDVVVFSKTITEVKPGSLIEVEFGFTAAFKAVSTATADLIWKWQARNKDGTWVDLHAAVSEANIGTTYVEKYRSGFFAIVANFNSVPFDIRLILQANETNEGKAKVKNSSYLRFLYQPA